MESLMPHLVEVHRMARLHHLLGDPHVHARAWALVDGEGYLREAASAFVHLMREEWPDWRGGRLPESMCAILCKRGAYVGRALSFRAEPRESFWFAQARHKTDVDALGAREREVALRYSRGQTHTAIASELGISPATVRNHVAHCYKRLAVSNKAELLQRLGSLPD